MPSLNLTILLVSYLISLATNFSSFLFLVAQFLANGLNSFYVIPLMVRSPTSGQVISSYPRPPFILIHRISTWTSDSLLPIGNDMVLEGACWVGLKFWGLQRINLTLLMGSSLNITQSGHRYWLSFTLDILKHWMWKWFSQLRHCTLGPWLTDCPEHIQLPKVTLGYLVSSLTI